MRCVKAPYMLPPCPDWNKYIMVHTREGYYWRKKRGADHKVEINSELSANAEAIRITTPLVRQFLNSISHHLKRHYGERMFLRMNHAFKKCLKKNGRVDYSATKDFVFYPRNPFPHQIAGSCSTRLNADKTRLQVEIKPFDIPPQNGLVTEYYFQLILVTGDPNEENRLEVETMESPLFPYGQDRTNTVSFETDLPEDKPWLAMIKLNSLEMNELAVHARHYGLVVVSWS
jgi:hypothetical protein